MIISIVMAAIEQALLTWIHLVTSAAIWVGGSLIHWNVVFAPILKKMSNALLKKEYRLMITSWKTF